MLSDSEDSLGLVLTLMEPQINQNGSKLKITQQGTEFILTKL